MSDWKCSGCNGRGLIGGWVGQTAESSGYEEHNCPDCDGYGSDPSLPVAERAAILLWHRLAPDHHEDWAEETHQAEYRMAAQAVIDLARPSF